MSRKALLALIALWIGAISTAAAQEPPAPQRRFRESMALETSAVVVKRLATVGEYLADGQIDEAVEILRDISAASGNTLVPVEPGRYVNARLYGHLMIAGLPPEGLAAYRQRVDAQARQWFEQGRDRRDEALVRRVVDQAFASSFGDDALWLLGEWAWDRGELSAARAYWTQMLAIEGPAAPGQPLPVLRYPDSDRAPAEILSRLVLVSIMTGDLGRAADELAVFRARYPDAEGELAGRRGSLVEILEAVLAEAREWAAPAEAGAYQTFAANAHRNAALPARGLDVGHVLWSDTLPPERWITENPRPALGPDPPLRLFPVVHGDMVLASDGQQIYHWKLRANEPTPVWPAGERGSVLYPDVPEAVRPGYISTRVIGVPRHTLTVHGGRLYAKLGSPIAGRTEEIRTFPSYIVCLDLSPDKQGKRVWELSADELLPDQPGWMFEGTPVAQGARVYVALRRNHPDATLRVACLDADTGRPIWNRQVGSSVFDVGDKSNLMSHQLLTLGENAVFYSTDMGAIVALAHGDGQPQWVVTYESQRPDEVEPLNDHLWNGLTPCLYHRGLLIAAPNDYQGVMAIDAETGLVRWEQRLPDRIRHLLGVGHGKVFVSGNSLWGMDLRTGNVRPPAGWGEPAEQNPQVWGYGQGLLVGDMILFPKRDAIDVREQSTGRRSRLIRLGEHDRTATGGNLAVAGQHLIVAEPNRIVVFSDTSGLLDEQRRIVEANPQSPQALLELGQTLVLAGKLDEGLDQFRSAVQLAARNETDAAVRRRAERQLFELLMRLGAQAADTGDLPQAVSHLTAASEQAPDDRARLSAVWRLAEIQQMRGRPEHAVRSYQSIIRDAALGQLPAPGEEQRTAAVSAQAAIDSLIATHGQNVYAAVEEEAGRQFAAAVAAGHPEAVRAALEQFPNARAAPGARLELVRLLRSRGELRNAAETCRRLLNADVEMDTRRGALELLARIHEDRGYWRLAARAWQRLADEFPQARLTPDEPPTAGDGPLSATQFVAHRLSSPDYAGELSAADGGPSLVWKRVWTRDLPPGGELIVPVGQAPALDLEYVLWDAMGLQAIDRSTGRDQWRARSDHPATWAAYIGEQLVVGTSAGLRGLVPERGDVLWDYRLDSPGHPTPEPVERTAPHFCAIRESVLTLQPAALMAIDAADGQTRWEFRPSGRLGPRWFCDDRQVMVQSFDPDRTLVVDSETGELVASFPGDAGLWRCDPVRLSPESFVCVDNTRRIRCLRVDSASPGWTYAGPSSHANADPDLIVAGDRLLAIIDGDTLVSVHPATGEREWSRPLSRAGLPAQRELLAVDEDSVYAAVDGILRRISLADGALLWERFVGPPGQRWAVQRFQRYVAARPVGALVAADPAVLICDAESGVPVQELRLPADAPESILDPATPAALLVSGRTLVGLGAMPRSGR